VSRGNPEVSYVRVVGGPLRTNSYIVYSQGAGLVVDPGVEPDRIREALRSVGVEDVPYILLTHGHFDHVYFAAEISEELGAAVLIHPADLPLLRRAGRLGLLLYARRFRAPERLEHLSGGQVVRVGAIEVRILHTPGHTPGSICAVAGRLLLTGDTLFKGAVGSTRFPGGSWEALSSSLARLASLPGDYLVLPGHGEETTLEEERRSNPFLRRRWLG